MTGESHGDGGDGRTDQPTVTVGSGGYRPDADADARTTAHDAPRTTADEPRTTAGVEDAIPPADESFDWTGWLLVAVVVVAFLVVPAVVLLRPVRVVGFRTTYLLLPLLPAFLLGATAVWVAVRSRRGDR